MVKEENNKKIVLKRRNLKWSKKIKMEKGLDKSKVRK